MTINVSKDVETSINAAVRSGRFPSADEAVTAAWRAFEIQPVQEPLTPQPSQTANTATAEKPIWEVMDELRKSVPPEELAKLPRDGAAQLDHYIYGSPKRSKS